MITSNYDKWPFILAGHSLGGYLSTQYVLKHPENIDKLILLSPVGVPEKPEGYSAETMIRNAESWKRR